MHLLIGQWPGGKIPLGTEGNVAGLVQFNKEAARADGVGGSGFYQETIPRLDLETVQAVEHASAVLGFKKFPPLFGADPRLETAVHVGLFALYLPDAVDVPCLGFSEGRIEKPPGLLVIGMALDDEPGDAVPRPQLYPCMSPAAACVGGTQKSFGGTVDQVIKVLLFIWGYKNTAYPFFRRISGANILNCRHKEFFRHISVGSADESLPFIQERTPGIKPFHPVKIGE